MDEAYANALSKMLRFGQGAGEMGLAAGSGLALTPVAGYQGLRSGISSALRGEGFGDAAGDAVRGTIERGMYRPRSDTGKRFEAATAKAFEAKADHKPR